MGTPTDEFEQRRSMLQEELARVGDLRLGSLIYRYRRCGKPGCLCSDPKHRVTAAGSFAEGSPLALRPTVQPTAHVRRRVARKGSRPKMSSAHRAGSCEGRLPYRLRRLARSFRDNVVMILP